MKSFIKKSASILLGLAIVGASIWGIYWIISSIWDALVSVDTKLAVGIVAAFTTVLGATLTVTIGKYLERKQAVEAHFRERKVEIYDEFLGEFFKLFENQNNMDDSRLVSFFQEWNRKVTVWGGSEVLRSYIKWMGHLKSSEPNAESMFLMGDFVLAVRKDLGLSNKGIDRKTFASLILKNPDLFLDMALKNPRVTLAELAVEEQRLGLSHI